MDSLGIGEEMHLPRPTVKSVDDSCSNILHTIVLCMLVMNVYSSLNLLTYTVDVMYSYEHGITRLLPSDSFLFILF